MESILLLEDGRVFTGEGFGAPGTTIGEVVFNTGMTGYQEILTDPSYKGQMVTMTYPHIGNYGINPEDVESEKPQVEGFIVRELCELPSNFRSTETLHEYLLRHDIPGIHQIDTRELTRHIREKGAMLGILSTEGLSIAEMNEKLKQHPPMEGRDLVRYVTSDRIREWEPEVPKQWYYEGMKTLAERQFHVVAYDYGIKHNILRLLRSFGFRVTVIPASTTAEQVRSLNPDGIFLSNGPGDPAAVAYAVESVRSLIGFKPMFGICLGHQILCLALGARTFKLKFGHHGSNHPVKDLKTSVIEITAQNHNFAVDTDSIRDKGIHITHLNLNDGTVEGMEHAEIPVYSVQYHPEASPGPHDSLYLFHRFAEMMNKSS
ncbi:glutamine-hydrolyzing carbamoyl-phosphate synthase small subunit [bacterium]|nr:glutamine-hydrolyzing carbamoyl-phosphate synthase small subunit [bacterium]